MVTRTRTSEVMPQVFSPPGFDIPQNALETSQKAPGRSEKEFPSLSLTSHVLNLGFLVTNLILNHNINFLHLTF